MSKLWSAVLAVTIVLASAGILGNVLGSDADDEGAYIKYEFTGEYVTTFWWTGELSFHEMETGRQTVTITEKGDDGYKWTVETRSKSTVSTELTIEDIILDIENVGDAENYERTGKRVSVNGKVTHEWRYDDGICEYHLLSDETLDMGRIYRLTVTIGETETYDEPSGRAYSYTYSFETVIDFDPDGSVRTWVADYYEFSKAKGPSTPLTFDSSGDPFEKDTRLGKRDVVLTTMGNSNDYRYEGYVDTKTGILLEYWAIETTDTFHCVAVSTNIRL